MKAIVYHEYGPHDVLRAADVDEPAAGDDEALVRIRAASVNPADWHFMRGEPHLIFQLAGTHSPSECRRALAPKGTLLLRSGESNGRWIGPLSRTLKALLLSPLVGQRLVGFTMKPNGDDLQFLRELIEAGTVTPVIDRTYPLAEVPDAIRYLEEGHARGKVVIAVQSSDA